MESRVASLALLTLFAWDLDFATGLQQGLQALCTTSAEMVPFSSTLLKAHKIAALALSLYVAFLVVLALPSVQRALVYLHHIRYPMAGLDEPETLGYAPAKVRNLYLSTPDNCTLGVWQVLPNSVYDAAAKGGIPTDGELPDSVFDAALR